MGHATRSRVIIEHLLAQGHQVRVVVSGRAHHFLRDKLEGHENLSLHEISGLTLSYADNRVERLRSLLTNLRGAPRSVLKNIEAYRQVAEDHFEPEMVFSDFESWAALYATNHFLPIVSIDNMQIIARCRHERSLIEGTRSDRHLAKTAVKIKIPGAYHYLVSSFFFPEVKKKRTTLVPPVLRPEILKAEREPGEHVLVYQTSSTNERLVETLRGLPYQFRFYGMRRKEDLGNVQLLEFSETGFIDDLRTARAVIAGGGFSLMSEAVSLRVPMLSVPVERQFEQQLNARYLEHLGYGAWATELDANTISKFVESSEEYARNLERYQRRDNSMLLACVDELLESVALGKQRLNVLETAAMGKWQPKKKRRGPIA
jgi:uncharacterized protein (TIGR00661 family)